MDEAGEILGEARFRVTEAEYIAAHRAERIARRKDYDSWPARIVNVLFGHLLLLLGAIFVIGSLGDGLTSWPLMVLGLLTVALGAWIADNWLYGYRRRYRKLHRAHPLANLDVERTFTPDRLFSHAANMDGSVDWRLFKRVVELRDGFVLEIQPLNTVWVPRHSLRAPFDADAPAVFLRSKIENYAVIDRRARLREGD